LDGKNNVYNVFNDPGYISLQHGKVWIFVILSIHSNLTLFHL
jgi:hypothetical protein